MAAKAVHLELAAAPARPGEEWSSVGTVKTELPVWVRQRPASRPRKAGNVLRRAWRLAGYLAFLGALGLAAAGVVTQDERYAQGAFLAVVLAIVGAVAGDPANDKAREEEE